MQFDSAKNRTNIRKHGVGFEEIAALDWGKAITRRDNRYDYGEERFISYVPLEGRLYCLVWAVRGGELRPISFRKANARERKRYEEETESA